MPPAMVPPEPKVWVSVCVWVAGPPEVALELSVRVDVVVTLPAPASPPESVSFWVLVSVLVRVPVSLTLWLLPLVSYRLLKDVPDEMMSEVPSVTTPLSVVVRVDGDESVVTSVSVPVSVDLSLDVLAEALAPSLADWLKVVIEVSARLYVALP